MKIINLEDSDLCRDAWSHTIRHRIHKQTMKRIELDGDWPMHIREQDRGIRYAEDETASYFPFWMFRADLFNLNAEVCNVVVGTRWTTYKTYLLRGL